MFKKLRNEIKELDRKTDMFPRIFQHVLMNPDDFDDVLLLLQDNDVTFGIVKVLVIIAAIFIAWFIVSSVILILP